MTSPRGRLLAALAGEKLDRPPVAFWRHFPVDDQNPETLAQSTVSFQSRLGTDLIKVTPASSFCLRDWGIADEWQGDPEGTRTYTRRVIRSPGDWRALRPLSPHQGELRRTLTALETTRRLAHPDVPVLATVFSPLAQAKNLAGPERLMEDLRSNSQDLLAGLEIIAASTAAFAEALQPLGIEGIFYAVQHASYRFLDADAYGRFGEPFDRRVFDAANGLPMNMLHLHGEALHFDLAGRLPAAAVNWHALEAGPSLGEARRFLKAALCGGLRRRETLTLGGPQAVREEAWQSLRSVQGRGIILGAGCVVPVITPESNLRSAVQAAAEFR